MLRRISLWTLCGFAVAMFWWMYCLAVAPWNHINPFGHPIFMILMPVGFLGRIPITYYWSIMINAAIYACVGLGAEMLRLAFSRRVQLHH